MRARGVGIHWQPVIYFD